MIKSFLICNKLIFIGNINELRPNTNPTLAMFDPTTFPIAIGDEPSITFGMSVNVPKLFDDNEIIFHPTSELNFFGSSDDNDIIFGVGQL